MGKKMVFEFSILRLAMADDLQHHGAFGSSAAPKRFPKRLELLDFDAIDAHDAVADRDAGGFGRAFLVDTNDAHLAALFDAVDADPRPRTLAGSAAGFESRSMGTNTLPGRRPALGPMASATNSEPMPTSSPCWLNKPAPL